MSGADYPILAVEFGRQRVIGLDGLLGKMRASISGALISVIGTNATSGLSKRTSDNSAKADSVGARAHDRLWPNADYRAIASRTIIIERVVLRIVS
jgi:hypothetical protein